MSLVDRDAEIARIRDAISAAQSGSGGVVLAVTGEPGAGKSALLREALADVPAYWGWCEPGLTPRPLGPFRDAIRDGALGTDEAPEDPSEALLAAMRDRPTVLALEDAHWIDDASARVLRFLGRRIRASRGVVVVSFRDSIGLEHPLRHLLADLSTEPVLQRIEIGPLSAGGVARVLDGTGRDPEEAYRVTAGNAFLVSALRDAPEEEIGASVRDLAWSWARRLEPAELELLKTLVVVPTRIPLDELRDEAPLLDAVVLSGLARVEGRWLGFRHELVRRALEAELTPDERLRAHAAAYRKLAGRPGADDSELAFHALGAGLVDEALHHEDVAARAAVASGAHAQAIDHLRRVTELADGRWDAGRVARAHLALAAEEWVAGLDAIARASAERAWALVKDSEDHQLLGAALLCRSRVAQTEAEAVGLVELAVAELEIDGDGPRLAEACAHAASRRMVARDLSGAAAWARRALAMVDEDEHPAIAVRALQALGCALTLGGNDDQCVYMRHALDVGRRGGVDQDLGIAYANYISGAGEARLYDRVAGCQDEAVAFFDAHDLDGMANFAYAWLGRSAFEQGRWDEATRWVDGVLSRRTSISDISAIVASTVRGRIGVRSGDGGEEALADAWEVATRMGALQRLASVAVARAEAAWLRGDEDDPSELLEALRLTEGREVRSIRAELQFWARRLGADVAVDVEPPGPWGVWLSGDPVAAGEAWLALGCPYEAADAFGESDDEEVLRRSLELLDQLGAPPLRARVTRRMRELGVRSIPRGPRKGTAADAQGLTAREQEVLTWLQEGRTDAEIATGLFLSVKTVGHHVSAILRKTGSASRRDLWNPGGF